jgi:hypothetical protein
MGNNKGLAYRLQDESLKLPVVAATNLAGSEVHHLLRCRHNMVEDWCAICLGLPLMGDGLDFEMIYAGLDYAYLRF